VAKEIFMVLPFLDSGARRRRDQMLAVDLGGRVTKAVHVQRRGDTFVLSRYAFLDSPIFENSIPVDLLTEQLKAVSQAVDGKCKWLTLTMGVNDALLRHVEMPPMPVEDMRQVLKNNSRLYLQQDLSGYVFDCQPASSRSQTGAGESARSGGQQKQKVLIGGAKKQLVDDFVLAARNAGLIPHFLLPGVIGPVNAFERAVPDVFGKQSCALVDIGFKSSSISVVQEGELVLSRVVGVGGDRLTSGLAESMNISYAEAEGIKIGMPNEVQGVLDSLLMPLGRELRASIDFFEHQQDRTVSQVYLSGGSSRSAFVVETLRRELMVECRTWNPTTFLKLALSPEQIAEVEHIAPQLAVAIGAAITAL
jgi:type IV pilus assembly protein PilM